MHLLHYKFWVQYGCLSYHQLLHVQYSVEVKIVIKFNSVEEKKKFIYKNLYLKLTVLTCI